MLLYIEKIDLRIIVSNVTVYHGIQTNPGREAANCIHFMSSLADDTYIKPVDRTAVDQRRILTNVVTKRIANRTEGNNDMQILATAADEKCKKLKRSQLRGISSVFVSRQTKSLRQLTQT